jgi:hypothetical protein
MKSFTPAQALIVRDLLDLCIENGFGSHYSLGPIADKHNINEVLYDNSTNTGILWELGRHGSGIISIDNDGETAGIQWECATIVEALLSRAAHEERKKMLKDFHL